MEKTAMIFTVIIILGIFGVFIILQEFYQLQLKAKAYERTLYKEAPEGWCSQFDETECSPKPQCCWNTIDDVCENNAKDELGDEFCSEKHWK